MSFNRDKKVIQNLLGDEFEREKEIIWTSPHGIKIVVHVDHKETLITRRRVQRSK